MKTKSPQTHFSPWSLFLLLILWPLTSNAQLATRQLYPRRTEEQRGDPAKEPIRGSRLSNHSDCQKLFYAFY